MPGRRRWAGGTKKPHRKKAPNARSMAGKAPNARSMAGKAPNARSIPHGPTRGRAAAWASALAALSNLSSAAWAFGPAPKLKWEGHWDCAVRQGATV